MSPKHDLKESYEIETKNGAFYLGGKITCSADGSFLLCGAGEVINLLDVSTGKVKTTLGAEGEEFSDPVLAFTSDSSCETVVSAHKSGLLKLWQNGLITKSWKSIHRGPICELVLAEKSLLVSAATDGVIRLWDLAHQSCTHALRGCQGVISVLKFHKKQIFACGDDLKIRSWTVTGKKLVELEGHFSKVTGLAFNDADCQLISCGRDKVVILWDMKTGMSLKTVPVYETLESLVLLPEFWTIPGSDKKHKGLYVAVAGDRGVIRVFDVKTGREVYVQTDSKATPATDGGLSVVQLLYNDQSRQLLMVTADQNIILHLVEDFTCVKQLIGFADEILDVCFLGPNESHIAVATNSRDIKVYKTDDMGCQLLRSHTDFVLGLASSPADPSLMLSCGKDNTVRLWQLDNGIVRCLATGERHTAAVNTVCFENLSTDMFVSAGVDTTLKLWKRGADGISVLRTEVAHSKEINCVAVSPNDKFVATASQDKSVKLWILPELKLTGVLSGHRRGVWSVRFSPVDQVVMTSSADCTIKLWSVADLDCLKTFQGHDSSVIRAEFLSRGMQIISCSGDGLLKLWSIKSSECVATFDGHEGKIWALDVSKNEDKLISGGSDSMLLVWRDTTEEKKLAVQEAREAMLLQEQQLNNLVQADQLFDALVLALSLDRPSRVLHIIKDLVNKEKVEGLTSTVSQLTTDQKERLLKCAAAWNTNSKHCTAAQLVISVLLDEIATGALTIKDLPSFLQEVLPYTERHFKRVTQSLQSLQILKYTLHQINPALT